MSDFKIRFRDQNTGRQIEVEANQVKEGWGRNQVEKSFEKSEVGDGTVDVMLKEDVWFWEKSRHLGVDSGSLSTDDASALKRALEDPRSAQLRVFDAQSGRELQGVGVLKTDAAGELNAVSGNLDLTGSRRPVQLTPTGHIATLDGADPQNLQEVGDGLFRVASLIDDVPGNLFDAAQAPKALKEKMLDNLIESLDQVAPGAPLPPGMDETQALQLRSSGATTMLELMTSKTQISNEVRNKAFEHYTNAIQQETNPMLKDSMLFNLNRLSGSLPGALRTQAEGIMDLAPTEPPYDKWFENGNDTVKVDWSVGAGEGFLEDNVKNLEKQGFEVVSRENGMPIMEKTYEKNGVETTFQVKFRTNRNSMFDQVDNDDTNMVIYSGHSNWGRNVRDSLAGVPDGSGEGKLVMTNLCVGKGELQQMKDKFPDAHMVTTYNSGYFRPGTDAEWHYAVNEMFDGIAARRGYEDMAEDVRVANPWTRDSWSTHRRSGIDNNFIFPTDLETRRRALDADHDGQADVFDRMVNFNSFNVETDTAREFSPITPARPAEELVGTNIHFAAMNLNRISIYSETHKPLNSTAQVVPGGYYTPEPSEANSMFRFTRTDGDTIKMEMNANYSHMSEEAIRMAAAFEYSQFKANDGLNFNDTDAMLNSLVFASQSLDTDKGYRDSAVWSEFTKAYNLPEISLRDVASARKADSHWYSGSRDSISSLRTKLGPDTIEQLSQTNVGTLRPE